MGWGILPLSPALAPTKPSGVHKKERLHSVQAFKPPIPRERDKPILVPRKAIFPHVLLCWEEERLKCFSHNSRGVSTTTRSQKKNTAPLYRATCTRTCMQSPSATRFLTVALAAGGQLPWRILSEQQTRV